MKSELDTFCGLDNRRELMILLDRLGDNFRRARFLEAIISRSRNGFAGMSPQIAGNCDSVAAYFHLVAICNELGVSINEAARLLEEEVRSR